jgi:hypothetical protein
MKTRERNHVDTQLAQIRVELTRETQTGRDTRHDCRNKLVKITIVGVGQLEGSKANVVKSLVINTECGITVLNKLVDRENSVIRFNNGIRDLGRRNNRVGAQNTVRVFFTDLGQQERTKTGTGTTTKRVTELETLETVGVFSLLADNVHDGLD